MLAQVLAMDLCLCVRVSVTRRNCIETTAQIELVVCKRISLDLSYTILG